MVDPITVTQTISRKDIANLLCSAFEGGSNYWYFIDRQIKPPAFDFLSNPDLYERVGEQRIFPHIDYPLNEGGALIITTLEKDEIGGKKEWTLDLPAIRRGLQVMSEKYPQHYADVIDEDDDATTGDVFLQCCLFGEVIYG